MENPRPANSTTPAPHAQSVAVRDRQQAETTFFFITWSQCTPAYPHSRVRNPAAGHRALIWPNISSGVWFLKVVGFASHLLEREHLRTRKERCQQANVQSHPLTPSPHLQLQAADSISPPATSPPTHPSPTLTCNFSWRTQQSCCLPSTPRTTTYDTTPATYSALALTRRVPLPRIFTAVAAGRCAVVALACCAL
jgi:hypothetical protein